MSQCQVYQVGMSVCARSGGLRREMFTEKTISQVQWMHLSRLVMKEIMPEAQQAVS